MSQPTPSPNEDEAGATAEADVDIEADAEASVETEPGVDAGSADPTTAGDAEADPRALSLDSEATGELISALSSETARSILVSLHDRPATASELAEVVDTSVQNVRHHLDNLRSADLVRRAGTRYSSKGREMDVYAPVDRPTMVVVSGEEATDRGDDPEWESESESETESDTGGFVDSLSRFVGAVVGLVAASLLVQWYAVTTTGDIGGVVRSADGLGGGAGPVVAPPGLLFFAGGALVLAVVSLWRFRQRTRA